MFKLKYVAFAVILMFGFSVALTTVHASATSTPSGISHNNGSVAPLYFFKAIGINITPELAAAAWKYPDIKAEVMTIWRKLVFGY